MVDLDVPLVVELDLTLEQLTARLVADRDEDAGGTATFAGSLGTQSVKVFDLVAAGTGSRDADARDAGYDRVTVETVADDHEAYYPRATPIRIRITGDRTTGCLLGAQLLGHHGAEIAKRVDTYATAISYGATVDDIADLDLSYTPPLGSPWDATQLATTAWRRAINSEPRAIDVEG